VKRIGSRDHGHFDRFGTGSGRGGGIEKRDVLDSKKGTDFKNAYSREIDAPLESGSPATLPLSHGQQIEMDVDQALRVGMAQTKGLTQLRQVGHGAINTSDMRQKSERFSFIRLRTMNSSRLHGFGFGQGIYCLRDAHAKNASI